MKRLLQHQCVAWALAGLDSKPSAAAVFLTTELQGAASTLERGSMRGLPASSKQ